MNQATALSTALLTALLLTTPAAYAAEHPPAVQALVDRGVTIVDQFEAADGLTGYVGEVEGQPVAFYLTAGGEHVLVGTLLDAAGNNLTAPEVETRVMAPKHAAAWSELESSAWVQDGADDADTIAYTFTDPNCPYCQQLRQAAEPWIAAGRLQLRHILVGILAQDSAEKAATILGSESPSRVLRTHQQRYDGGGIEVDERAAEAGWDEVMRNTALMESLGLNATPSTYYRKADGKVGMYQGLPPAEAFSEIFGGPRP